MSDPRAHNPYGQPGQDDPVGRYGDPAYGEPPYGEPPYGDAPDSDSPYPDSPYPDFPYADSEPEAGVDALLRDDALLDALGRGELPATYRADVTARLLTGWRDDLDEGLPPLSGTGHQAPVLLATVPTDRDGESPTSDATDVLPRLLADGFSDDTTPIPALTDPDRIDESVRSAFVAAGYARPADELPPVRATDAPTHEFAASFDRLPPVGDDTTVTRLGGRRPRRRRFDRVVVAVAATAAIVAAGSAGSVAAAATAHPGDTLWPISRVVYADRARSIEASEQAHASLEKARDAMERGDTEAAKRYLADAQEKLDAQVREGSDEAEQLAEDLQTMTAIPELQPEPGDPAYSPGTDPSSGSTPTNPSARSRWQHRNPRGGTTATTQPSAPTTTQAPTPDQPTNPAPTTGQPDPGPTTQAPDPTPSEAPATPDPVPTEEPSSGSTVDQSPGDASGVESAPASE